MPENISICLNRDREESVGNDDVSIVRAREYEVVTMCEVILRYSFALPIVEQLF